MQHPSYSLKFYLKALFPAFFSLILLATGMVWDHFQASFFSGYFRLAWYVTAYLPVAFPVIGEALKYILKGNIFTEFFLMAVATAGAFAIGEYPEAVGVMLFYAVGEFFQELAVDRAQANIKGLIDQRPDTVSVLENGATGTALAKEVPVGTVIRLKPGEKVALDGILLSGYASFNTAALTGESKPDTKTKGESVLAGMINLNSPADVKVTALYEDSKLSRILELVQQATEQKAPTELFIRKFARYYTPAVVAAALLICLAPALIVEPYIFSDWLYRALVFLVISCPCALVISIPLSYFGGIGAASRHGILFKGSNYLDLMASVKHIVMDKTGTLTEGVFQVKRVVVEPAFDTDGLIRLVNVLESHSTHPVATAIAAYAGVPDPSLQASDVEEIPGRGLKGTIAGKTILAGNTRLLDSFEIPYTIHAQDLDDTVIAVAIEGVFAGYLTIADQIKPDAKNAVDALKRMNIRVMMLSGDKETVVRQVAGELGIDDAYGNLLPEDKVSHIQEIKQKNESVVFVGDGVNDAPVIAISDAGIAMGGLGSDAAIEIADIVIQDDEPSKIPMAVRIGKETKKIVKQNIIFAFAIKLAVLILGAEGIATLWEAVFADVGVALLAILNAMRIQRKNFEP